MVVSKKRDLFASVVLGVDFEAEAREIARLHFVVDEEADADGKRNQAGSGHDEQHTYLEDDGQQQAEDDDAEAACEQDHGGAADVIESAERVNGIFICGLTLHAFDVINGHASGEQCHSFLRAQTPMIHLGIDTRDTEAEDHEAAGYGDDEGRKKVVHGGTPSSIPWVIWENCSYWRG
jgi:hypothetical protein